MTGVADLPALRRGRQRARRSRQVLVGLLAAAALGGLGWLVLASPVLAVDAVAVRGTQRLTAEQVRVAAEVVPGTPLARVDVAGVRARVGRLAPVASVRVVRGWPGTLELTVVERTAVVGVLGEGGFALLDADGVAFAHEPALPKDAVRLQADRPGARDPATRAGLAVLAELPAPLRERTAIVRAHGPEQVSLLLRDGREVVWGPPGRAADKAAAALALLRLPGVLYDVTSPDVVVRRGVAEAGTG